MRYVLACLHCEARIVMTHSMGDGEVAAVFASEGNQLAVKGVCRLCVSVPLLRPDPRKSSPARGIARFQGTKYGADMGSTFSAPTFLREHRDRILREWAASVQAEAPIVDLKDALLRNHIPELVETLADWLEGSAAPGSGELRLAAVAHADQRLEHGFQLKQLIHEVRLLRETILRLLLGAEALQDARDTAAAGERVIALARLNTGLDRAVAEAVEHFTAERERRIRQLADREIEQARQADARKTAFLAALSHELRNPLAPILNGVHILECAEPGSEQSLRARDVIRRQTRHLTRLVDDLLDLTRISHGKIELHRKRFDLRDVVRATCDDHRSLVEQRGLVLRLELASGPVWIDGDPTRIAQILSNLLQNGVKFTAAGGTIGVSLAVNDQRVSLHVRDDGVGMEQAVIERIFEPFAQAQQQIARQQGGLGLGLALVKGLAELHGGSVSAQSAGPGRGSEFVVELPLAVSSVAETVAASAPSLPSRLVVIIEDNIDNGDTLAEVLELEGHRVRVARTAKSGIALAQDLKPDVVVCDIGLPDMDGYEVARVLRTNGDLATTRLIALSGYAQPEDRKRAKEAGFDAHLAKPPPLDELSAILAD